MKSARRLTHQFKSTRDGSSHTGYASPPDCAHDAGDAKTSRDDQSFVFRTLLRKQQRFPNICPGQWAISTHIVCCSTSMVRSSRERGQFVPTCCRCKRNANHRAGAVLGKLSAHRGRIVPVRKQHNVDPTKCLITDVLV